MHGQEAVGHQITAGCYSESFKQCTPTVTVTGNDRGGLKFQWKFQKLLSFSTGFTITKTVNWKKMTGPLNHLAALKTTAVPVSPFLKHDPTVML